jgi:hypothetical protein
MEREKYMESKAIDARVARLLGRGAEDGGYVEPRMSPHQEEKLKWVDPNDVAHVTERLTKHPEIVDLLIQTSPSLRDDGEGGSRGSGSIGSSGSSSNSGHSNGEPYDKEEIQNILGNVLVEDGRGRRPARPAARDTATALEPPRDSGQVRGDRDVANAIARAFGRDQGPVPTRGMSGSGATTGTGRMSGSDRGSFGSRSFNSAWRGRTLD